ncbi:hypothetical protein NQ315_009657 [Exocentrus adspersus]|uniref:Uncharacterized protein n=1 Tax=Exocentrus adspersus TaxID=1586481 RepID=A0AAV8WHU2_9CUCU|nr:hypothetical protein NQ315_009657 [Exocentrus adspersus]
MDSDTNYKEKQTSWLCYSNLEIAKVSIWNLQIAGDDTLFNEDTRHQSWLRSFQPVFLINEKKTHFSNLEG